MTISLSPSVVVVRSSCLPSAGSQERESTHRAGQDTSTHTPAVDSSNNDAHFLLQRSLQALPVTCDIVVLPEIPVDESMMHGGSSNVGSHDLRMERQALHPCGMDNVLLLRNLPPAVGNPASYLLSLTSCEALVTHIETSSGEVVEVLDPTRVPIQAAPSTFLFAIDNNNNMPSSHTPQSESLNNGVVVNPKSASAELNVVFDSSLAMNRLQEVLAIDTQGVVTSTNLHEEKNEPPPMQEENNAQSLPSDSRPANGAHLDMSTKEQALLLRHDPLHQHQYQQDELVRVMRALAEKEAMHLDYMLAGLALVFLLLLVHYARTVLPVIRAKRILSESSSLAAKKRNKLPASAPSHSLASETMPFADRTADAKRNNVHRPPVNSVTFHRSGRAADPGVKDASALLQDSRETFPTSKAVASPSSKGGAGAPFVASESTIGMMAETSSLSSASARDLKHFTFLPPTDYSPKKPIGGNAVPEHESVGAKHADQQYSQLSPCSKLARHWMQSKEKRRECRKDSVRSHYDVISPVAEIPTPTLAPEDIVSTSPTAGCTTSYRRHLAIPTLSDSGPNALPIPTFSYCGPNALIRDFIADRPERSPRPVYSRNAKVSTPETCLMSEESFLQDYWGE